ncbi:MAG: hypothetical protein AYW80_01550 [Bifidobacterium bifidum]|jgi:hypothetical protein|nr:Hypothetical protein RY70_1567 [Bifidobacterium bifidum]EKE50928.1 hypothetical protein B216_03619 [Bifidobacterium bifidum LMG 13195]KXS27979.1 MAG: hypothetical protein AYW80_01550 [Bifidobacterium bifidum]
MIIHDDDQDRIELEGEPYDHDDDSQQHEIIRFHMEILPALYTHEVVAVCPRRVNRTNLRL